MDDLPSEPEYGSINILTTDDNSYVLTPKLHSNTETVFNKWPQLPKSGEATLTDPQTDPQTDQPTEHTCFLHHPEPHSQANIKCLSFGNVSVSDGSGSGQQDLMEQSRI